MDTHLPELIDEDMASQDSAPISTPADAVLPSMFAAKQSLISGGDIEMKDDSIHQNIHAPPSPAPSGDSPHATNIHRPSPSPVSAPSYSAGDHPETSIPSPASPSAGADSLSVDAPPFSSPAPLASPTMKHEHDEDADAMIDEDQRPAKRARTADVASPPHSSSSAAVPPLPRLASTDRPTHTTLSPQQFKFAQSTLRSLRKQKDAYPFNVPVDPVALNIPHYTSIVTRPMDLGTVDRKLAASNPAKKIDAASANEPRYYSILEFYADIKLVWDNCLLFNGPDHVVSQCARRLESLFDKQIKNMPPPQAPAPVFKSPTPVAAPPPPAPETVASTSKKAAAPRRSSTSVPTIRRTDSANASDFVSARPKREIHPPPPKDSGYDDQAPKRAATGPRVGKNGKRKKDDGTLDQLRFCVKIINDLYKKQYSTFAQYFYDPVSEEYAPNYYKIIKKPMDMSTLKRNLDQKVYPDANAFYDDFQLMISNCVRYNPVGTLVYIAGQDLAKAFNEKWRALPPLRSPEPSDDEDEEDENAPDPNTIQALEAQLAGLRETIDALKTGGKPKGKGKADSKPAFNGGSRQPSTSNATKPAGGAAPRKAPAKKSASSKKGAANGAQRRALDADAQLTFEEKKELSETIQNLEGGELEEVIQIIHDGVPDIGDNTDEIEIEIDALPPAVLRALWNAVIKPKQPPPPPVATTSAKPFKSGRNQAGTGGLKRKSMDEAAESEKMRLLEQRISMFDAVTSPAAGVNGAANGANGARQMSVATVQNPNAAGDADSTHSSDSESDSGSSSDSD